MFLEKNPTNPVLISSPVEKAATPALVDGLKVLLADVFTFYLRAHGFHWNVTGQDFTQFHELFGEISDDAFGSVDPIAENLRKLNQTAPASLMEFMQTRTLGEATASNQPGSMAADLAAANDQVLVTLNRAFAAANDANEQGIANFLAERIDSHQKWGWQLRMSAGR